MGQTLVPTLCSVLAADLVSVNCEDCMHGLAFYQRLEEVSLGCWRFEDREGDHVTLVVECAESYFEQMGLFARLLESDVSWIKLIADEQTTRLRLDTFKNPCFTPLGMRFSRRYG